MSDDTKQTTALVPHESRADVVEVDSDTVVPANIAGAIGQLQDMLTAMKPDDFLLEAEVDRVRAKIRLRAYRHRRKAISSVFSSFVNFSWKIRLKNSIVSSKVGKRPSWK